MVQDQILNLRILMYSLDSCNLEGLYVAIYRVREDVAQLQDPFPLLIRSLTDKSGTEKQNDAHSSIHL